MKMYRVTGDYNRLVYSEHDTQAAAERAAAHLRHKWGPSVAGSEPRVERLTLGGWVDVKTGLAVEA